MKKVIYIIAAAFVFVLVGCNKDGDKIVDLDGDPKATLALCSTDSNVEIADGNLSGTVVFKTRGGSAHVDVRTNLRSYSIENSGSNWLTVEKDDTGILLSVAPNAAKEGLSATVTITPGAGGGENAIKATLQVIQRGPGDPDIELETNKVVFIPQDHNAIRTIQVTTNQDDWSFETESASYWLRIEKGADNTLVLQPDSNSLMKNDTLIVRIKAGVGQNVATEKLMIVNEAAAVIAFYPLKVIFMKAGSTEEVLVASTQAWQVGEYAESWVSTRIENGKLMITAKENPGDEQRTCRLPLICSGTGENTVTEFLDILQWGKSEDLMVFEYKTTSANTVITLPLVGTVNGTVNWGDGASEEVTQPKPTHKYAVAGTYQVKIQGRVTELNSNGLNASNPLLVRVLQWGKTGLTSMDNAFYGCENLTSIPGDVIHSFDEVTTFSSAFSACYALTEIPADLLVNASKATNFDYMFSCSIKKAMDKITEIPAGLFDNCGNAESFSGLFWARRALTTIPEGLFNYLSKATDFSYLFYETAVTTVPAQLFAYCREATDLSSLFAYGSLQTVPASLLRYNVKVTNISSMFANCKLLKEIPAGLFDGLTEVTTISSLFSKCELVKSIPSGLFASMDGKLTNAGTLFNGCKALQAIPAGLFDKMTGVTNISSAFQDCTTLTAIPAGLFKNSPEVTNIGRVFNGCTALQTVPADLFNCPNVTSANNAASLFQNCTSLRSVPAGLLDSFTGATGLATLFSGCTALETVPVSILDKCTKVNSFANAFFGCTALRGESPYTEVDGVKVHLYERSEANGFKTPSNKTKCFNGCTSLSDYESIPAAWK